MTRIFAILACCLTFAWAVAPRETRGDELDALFVETAKPAGEVAADQPVAAGKAVAEVEASASAGVTATRLDGVTDPPAHTLHEPTSQAENDAPFTAVPEPSAIILALAAFAYFLLFARRRRI